jgi:hypothetical protein
MVRTLWPISRPMSQNRQTSCSSCAVSTLSACSGQQDQQIDVGRRVQFAAAVATDRNQRERGRHRQLAPEFVQRTSSIRRQRWHSSRAASRSATVLLADHPLSILQAGLQGLGQGLARDDLGLHRRPPAGTTR